MSVSRGLKKRAREHRLGPPGRHEYMSQLPIGGEEGKKKVKHAHSTVNQCQSLVLCFPTLQLRRTPEDPDLPRTWRCSYTNNTLHHNEAL